jgi:hypothetical protein
MRTVWIYKMMLGPVLLAQGKKMRRTALRLPEAAGQRTGVVLCEGNKSELKLLFVGDSTMAGVGVEHQIAALAFQVASILAKLLGQRVRWQLVAKSGVNTSQAFEFAKGQELSPADVLVTALGVNDVTSQKTSCQFVADYEALIHWASAAGWSTVCGHQRPASAARYTRCATTTSLVLGEMRTSARRTPLPMDCPTAKHRLCLTSMGY